MLGFISALLKNCFVYFLKRSDWRLWRKLAMYIRHLGSIPERVLPETRCALPMLWDDWIRLLLHLETKVITEIRKLVSLLMVALSVCVCVCVKHSTAHKLTTNHKWRGIHSFFGYCHQITVFNTLVPWQSIKSLTDSISQNSTLKLHTNPTPVSKTNPEQ